MSVAIKTNALNNLVAAYVVTYKAGQAAAVTLRDALIKSGIALVREELRQPLMHSVALAYGVKLQTKMRGEGVTWMKDTISGNASQCHQRLLADLFGAVAKSEDVLAVPAEVQAAADKLVKLCSGYKVDGKSVEAKMRATAIAIALAK